MNLTWRVTCLSLLVMLTVYVTSIQAEPLQTQAINLGKPKLNSERFIRGHAGFLQRAQEGPVELLFLGDSITADWKGVGKKVWQQYYHQYQSANFGIGGDQTENVLWRIENGELDRIRPKVIVLLVGTNDSRLNNAIDTANLNKQIIKQIQLKSPQSKVLLLAVFPRGPRTWKGVLEDSEKRMQMIKRLNRELAKSDDGKRVRFLNINAHFIKNGLIPKKLMPDQLHLSEKGYEVWAEAMMPLLNEMMSSNP